MVDRSYRVGDNHLDDKVDDRDGDEMEMWRRTLGKLPSENIREAELELRARNLHSEAEGLVDLRLSVEEFEVAATDKVPELEEKIEELEYQLSEIKDDLEEAKAELVTANEKLEEHDSSFAKERAEYESQIADLEKEVEALREQLNAQNNG